MSQEKVNRNKELKHNRRKIVKRQKIQRIAAGIAAAVVCAALVVWIGFSLYNKYEDYQKENTSAVSVDMSSISEYLNSLSGDAEK